MFGWRGTWLAIVLLASACAGSTDGGTPTRERSRVGECHTDGGNVTVPCTDEHVAQTVYVGGRPPRDNAAALAPCRPAMAQFLGQDFNTRLDLEVWVPDDRSWYRCDVLLRLSTKAGEGYQTLTGSLAVVLSRGVSLDLQSCLGEPFDPAVDQTYVPCREPHIAHELIVAPALGTLTEPYPGDVADRAVNSCNATASASGELVKHRRVDAYFPKNAEAWASGERTASCWATAVRGTLPPVRPTP